MGRLTAQTMSTTKNQSCLPALFCILTTQQQKVLTNKDMYQYLYGLRANRRVKVGWVIRVVSKVESFLSNQEVKIVSYPLILSDAHRISILPSVVPSITPLCPISSLSFYHSFCAYSSQGFFYSFPLFFSSLPSSAKTQIKIRQTQLKCFHVNKQSILSPPFLSPALFLALFERSLSSEA
ncbi:MAG: hypothetical protein JOS17DRAFT_114748 [Linnemannia elongata]|nr:MAG: hypothetical protein JOS17DRAFT_114748 [Linnemannia elongata]